MPVVRTLPPRPSLEYERKAAKALLRRLRAGNPDALARARAQEVALDRTAPATARLADAQFIIAREYGFASWPRLVHYFARVERQLLARQQIHGGRDSLERSVRSFLAEHGARSASAGRALAAYVPRFYGLRPDEALDTPITEDDARLAVARMYGASSWEVLLERAAWGQQQPGPWKDPWRDAASAMAAHDLTALEQIVSAHPELLRPTHQDVARARTLIAMAVGQEERHGIEAMRAVIEWLEARGFDRQHELNSRLCGIGGARMSARDVRDLIVRGADPNWVAPNGIPVLEHALLRYWNAEAVDALAPHTTPRDALWINAGLGDVDGVRRFLDRQGRPTDAARRLRPDFDAVGRPLASLPDPGDEELLVETLVVATLNERTEVLEEMAARGAPLDSLVYGMPLIYLAVGNGFVSAVECLVRCGADLDLRGRRPNQSARENARSLFESMPGDAGRRRIVALCGMDPDAILAERDARPTPRPALLPMTESALALAMDDAVRLGQPGVGAENLLIGLMRADAAPLHFLVVAGIDLARFRSELADRLRPVEDRVIARDLPMNADAQAAVDGAVAVATERREDVVNPLHLLLALTRFGEAPAVALLERYGADTAAMNVEIERSL
jgi:hypothetical protein